jgi:hypothetical protein
MPKLPEITRGKQMHWKQSWGQIPAGWKNVPARPGTRSEAIQIDDLRQVMAGMLPGLVCVQTFVGRQTLRDGGRDDEIRTIGTFLDHLLTVIDYMECTVEGANKPAPAAP